MKTTNLAGYKLPKTANALLRPTIVAIFVVGSLVQYGAAQDAALTGIWKLEENPKEETQRKEAIEQAVQGVNLLMRGKARELISEKTKPVKTLQIVDHGSQITLYHEKQKLTLSTNGPVPKQNQNGEATHRAKRQNSDLTVTSQSPNGLRMTIYRMSKDKSRLTLEINISSSKLENAICYRTTYQRAPQQASVPTPVRK